MTDRNVPATVSTTLTAEVDIATAPWFGLCRGCGRELGNRPELVGRLDRTDRWHCFACFEHIVTERAVKRLAEGRTP